MRWMVVVAVTGCGSESVGADLLALRGGVLLLTEEDTGPAGDTAATTPPTTPPTEPAETGDTAVTVTATGDTGAGVGCGDGVLPRLVTIRPSPVEVEQDLPRAWFMSIFAHEPVGGPYGYVCSLVCDQGWLDTSEWALPTEVSWLAGTELLAVAIRPFGDPATCTVEFGDGSVYHWTVEATGS